MCYRESEIRYKRSSVRKTLGFTCLKIEFAYDKSLAGPREPSFATSDAVNIVDHGSLARCENTVHIDSIFIFQVLEHGETAMRIVAACQDHDDIVTDRFNAEQLIFPVCCFGLFRSQDTAQIDFLRRCCLGSVFEIDVAIVKRESIERHEEHARTVLTFTDVQRIVRNDGALR